MSRVFTSQSEARTVAPKLSEFSDRIGMVLPISMSAIGEWLAILELVRGLLMLYSGLCGQNETIERQVAYLRRPPLFSFFRFRLRRAIAVYYSGSVSHSEIRIAIEWELRTLNLDDYSEALLEANSITE